MKVFQHVSDIGDLRVALAEAQEVKRDRYQWQHLGRNKTALLIFFNNSLRTRLSTQKAAMNLGMNVIVLDVNQGAWKLETERGVIMDGDKSEHLLEAIPVMASYCDLIGVRSFARFESREDDYEEKILNQFIRYSGRPVFFMESATVHPLQAFADLITIEEQTPSPLPLKGERGHLQDQVPSQIHSTLPLEGESLRVGELCSGMRGGGLCPGRPIKVVLSWAPHPKALPQAVPNSFAEWMLAASQQGLGIDFVITHPEGYELDPQFAAGACVEYDQMKAFEGADFVYAKNWSCPGVTRPEDYGKVLHDYHTMMDWCVSARQMAVTNDAHFMHCLPVRRNMIVTDDVIESPRSLVIPEAANREISAQVVLKRMLEAL